MALFVKRKTVFRKRDKAAWTAAKEALAAAGIQGVKAGHYEAEPPVGGCGCKLDIRNFGPNGRIDREVYYLDVPVEYMDQAKKALGPLAEPG